MRKNPFNIDELLKPYRDGGTESNKVKRTLDTIINQLVLKNKFSPEIAGAAIFKVFSKIANENITFDGDGSYGSPGRELFSCIKAQAIDLAEKTVKKDVILKMYEKAHCVNFDCPQRNIRLVRKTKWQRFIKFIAKPRGYWKL